MAFVKPPSRNMPPGSEPWAQWVEEQMSSVTKKSVEAYQYAERAAGGANSALDGNIQNWDEINRVFEVAEKSMQLADGAVVWSTLDPELPEDVPINPNVIWYTYVPETREVLRMWRWGYYDADTREYREEWYQAQLGADSIHDEAITSAKVALGAIDWDQIAPDVENTVTTAQETAEKAATDAAQAKTDVITAINKANSAVVTADEAKTAANTAQTDATSAQTAAQEAKTAADTAKATADTAASDLLTLSGKTGRVIRSTTAPTGVDRNSNNLWLNTTSGQLSEWTGTAWVVITDSRLTAATSAAASAQTRADQAVSASGAAQERADLAKDLADAANLLAGVADGKAATAQAAATAAGSSAASAQSKADTAFANAATAQSTADQAKTAASSAQTKADTAAADLLALAGKSGRLIRSASAPTSADDKNVNNLWLNTGNGQLSQWSGSAWTLITDSRLTAATNAAATAQSTADTAKTNAATAQAKADSAFTNAATAKTAADNAMAAALGAQSTADTADGKASTANGRITIGTANPTATDAVGKPIGALWEVRSGSTVLRRFVLTGASTWTQVKAGQDFIGANAIGSAQIADLAVGTAQIADLAVTNGKIGSLNVDKLTVVGGAKMPVAVIDSLVGDEAFLTNLLAKKVVVGDGTNLWWDQEYQGQPGVGWVRDGLAYKRAGTGAQTGTYPEAGSFPVTPGDQLWVSATRTNVSGSTGEARLYFQRSTDGRATWGYWTSVSMPVAGSASSTFTVPADTTHVRPGLFVNADMPTATTVKISDIQIRRKTGSVLIEDGAVTADKIVANAITARELAVGAITADKAIIANAAIKSAMIADANILTAHIDNLAVTNAKIANTTITNAKILNLDAGKITTGFLDAARIQANSIVASKLAATAIDGMTITGSTIQTSSSANTGIKIDTANGLRAWAGGNLGVQISPSIKNGIAVRNPTGQLVPLSDAVFGIGVLTIPNFSHSPATSGGVANQWSPWWGRGTSEEFSLNQGRLFLQGGMTFFSTFGNVWVELEIGLINASDEYVPDSSIILKADSSGRSYSSGACQYGKIVTVPSTGVYRLRAWSRVLATISASHTAEVSFASAFSIPR